jgi:uncharacterized protein (DUF4415 family)
MIKVLMLDFWGRECRSDNTASREIYFRSTVAKQRGTGITKATENNVTVRIDKDVLLFYVSV